MSTTERPTELTRDAGWQIGASRTFPVDRETAWAFLTAPAGLALWLGEGVAAPLARGERYTTADGTTGEVRSVRPLDRVRLTWQPPGRPEPATVQLALTPAATGTTVRFHTDRLSGPEEREALRRRWAGVLDRLGDALPGAG